MLLFFFSTPSLLIHPELLYIQNWIELLCLLLNFQWRWDANGRRRIRCVICARWRKASQVGGRFSTNPYKGSIRNCSLAKTDHFTSLSEDRMQRWAFQARPLTPPCSLRPGSVLCSPVWPWWRMSVPTCRCLMILSLCTSSSPSAVHNE